MSAECAKHPNGVSMSNFNSSEMKKYPNGYLPKIVYHLLQGNKGKVEYFVARHEATYGPLTDADRQTMAKLYFNETAKQ
jgi:hypothetical protein